MSKLKLYINIAKAIAESGPLTLNELTSLLKVNPSLLEQPLNFLVREGMISEKDASPTPTYSIAKRGVRVLRYFKVLPSIKIVMDKS